MTAAAVALPTGGATGPATGGESSAAVRPAAVTSPAQTYTTPGTYYLAVPANAISVHLDGLGGAGRSGDTAPSNYGPGGAGGHGTAVSTDVAVGPAAVIKPGSTLAVRVGALGGGAPGGSPSYVGTAPEAGAGGAGGGATSITSADGTLLLVGAGGGGGGGGGNGGYAGFGGSNGAGQGTGINGAIAAKGGEFGAACTGQVGPGAPGESNNTLYNLGGGGGGGGEGCLGGGAGGSGDHGSGASHDGTGGGGAGAGNSMVFGTNRAGAAGTNTGDGSATVTFTTPGPGDGPYSTTLTATPNPARVGGPVTLTASTILDVTGAPAPGTASIVLLAPQGAYADGCPPVATPTPAPCNLLLPSSDPAGVYEARVYYAPPGAPYGALVTTAAVAVIDALRPTSTTLTAPTPLTSTGGTLRATVTPTQTDPQIPTGTVTFTDGVTPLCVGPVALAAPTPDQTDGVADCPVGPTVPGPHHYSATYSGDNRFAGSTGGLDATVAPALRATSVTVSSSVNPALPAQPVTFTATITPTTPVPVGIAPAGGTVSFSDGTTPLGTAPLTPTGASMTTSTLGVGPHPITASYSGDPVYAGSSSAPLAQQVDPAVAATITATSGGAQSAQTGHPYPQPLVATVTDTLARPLGDGAPVTFTVTNGSASFAGGASATVATGPDGRATAPTLTAGTTAGPISITATTPGVATPAIYAETVTAPVPGAITPTAGSAQTAQTGHPYPTPLVATVTDALGGALPGAPVTFTVTNGSASFPAGASAAVTTDPDGRATAPTLTAGNTAGSVTITATTPRVTGSATYAESVTAPTPSGPVRADLVATLTAPTTAAAGSTFQITLTVRNNGPYPAPRTGVAIAVGPGLTVTTPDGGTTGPDRRTVGFLAPELAPATAATYTVTVTAGATARGPQILGGGVVSSRVLDPNYTNNYQLRTITITPPTAPIVRPAPAASTTSAAPTGPATPTAPSTGANPAATPHKEQRFPTTS